MEYRSANKQSRRGVVAVLVAVTLSMLLGIVAIAVDGGLLQDNKRRVQNAADAAAIAAANKLFSNYPSITLINQDPNGQGVAAGKQSATDNGFSDGGSTSVVVNIPPKSGPFTNLSGYAEIIITYQQPRYFSAIWGSATMPVAARAVARGYWGGTGNGVIVLDPSAKDSLDASGGGSVNLTGGASMIVDSSHYEAGRQTGGGQLTAADFEITGGYTGTFNGPVHTGVPPIPDPLAYLPVPATPANGSITQTSLTKGNHQYVLTPGSYNNLPNFNTGDVVIFKQASYGGDGIYFINGGGFSSTGATIVMDPTTSGGIMIYNNPSTSASSNSISIQGNSAGVVNLTALESGPYAGILFWEKRESTVPLSISGNGTFKLSGTFYAANANLQVTGNGIATIGSQYISRTLSLSGNGGVIIDYTDNGTARKREVRLVE